MREDRRRPTASVPSTMATTATMATASPVIRGSPPLETVQPADTASRRSRPQGAELDQPHHEFNRFAVVQLVLP